MANTNGSRPEDHRRKWDQDEYEKLANNRIRALQEAEENRDLKKPTIQRDFVRQRDYKVDIDSNVGKYTLVTKSTPRSQSGGYFCKECDCVVKDSLNYLDHINGKKHQRNLGMSMRIERSTLEQVKQRFKENKEKAEDKKKEYNFEDRMRELQEQEDRVKEYRREKRKEKKRKASEAFEDNSDADPEIAAMMGFSGFGTSKK